MPSGWASWPPYPQEVVIAGMRWAEELSTFPLVVDQSGWRSVLIHLIPISEKGVDRSEYSPSGGMQASRAAW